MFHVEHRCNRLASAQKATRALRALSAAKPKGKTLQGTKGHAEMTPLSEKTGRGDVETASTNQVADGRARTAETTGSLTHPNARLAKPIVDQARDDAGRAIRHRRQGLGQAVSGRKIGRIHHPAIAQSEGKSETARRRVSAPRWA